VLNDAFIVAVWQQSLAHGAKHVAVGGKTYPVQSNLARIDFELAGQLGPAGFGLLALLEGAIAPRSCNSFPPVVTLPTLFSGKVTHTPAASRGSLKKSESIFCEGNTDHRHDACSPP
jgi:hypothetical protein